MRARAGFVLPLVIVSTLLVALLAAGAQSAAWRATRATRHAWNGERALLAADESMARLQAAWTPGTFTTRAIGQRWSEQYTTADRELVTVQVVRTQPLIAWMEAVAGSRTVGTPRAATRRIARAIWLQPPALPFGAALASLSPVELHAGAVVSGHDDISRHDDCGTKRDSASVAGVESHAPRIAIGARLTGLPPTRTPTDSARDARLWAHAWPLLRTRSLTRALPTGPGPATLGSPWHAIALQDSVPIAIAGTLTHEGLLIVEGDLVITGTLRLHGMLLVSGSLDARVGTLQVDGSVMVRSPSGTLSHIGGGSSVRYSQCATQRALAAVAMPLTQPFALWSER